MPQLTATEQAWRREAAAVSLPEVYRSVLVPSNASFFRKLLAFAGPGFLGAGLAGLGSAAAGGGGGGANTATGVDRTHGFHANTPTPATAARSTPSAAQTIGDRRRAGAGRRMVCVAVSAGADCPDSTPVNACTKTVQVANRSARSFRRARMSTRSTLSDTSGRRARTGGRRFVHNLVGQRSERLVAEQRAAGQHLVRYRR